MWRFFLTQKEWQVTNFITDTMFWPKKPVAIEYNLLDYHEFFFFFFLLPGMQDMKVILES